MTAPLFGAPDPAPPANPWDLARAIWPGAFAAPWQDLQIEQGRGDWPTVATCWRPPRAWRVWIRPLVLHPLPSLRWRYDDEAPGPHTPEGDAMLKSFGQLRRRSELTHKQARDLGYRYFVPKFPAGALGVKLPEVRDVVTGQRFRPSIRALAELVEDGVITAPPRLTEGGALLARHGTRRDRIAAKYPDGLPMFGGAL